MKFQNKDAPVRFLAACFCVLTLASCVKDGSRAAQSPLTDPDHPSGVIRAGPPERNVTLNIAGQTFTVTLEQTLAAEALLELLPATLRMEELNGEEKFTYLPQSLPVAAEEVRRVQAGDVMLYGTNCLVLFYTNAPTSYRYTKIGRIDKANGLAQALGSGSVMVLWSIGE